MLQLFQESGSFLAWSAGGAFYFPKIIHETQWNGYSTAPLTEEDS